MNTGSAESSLVFIDTYIWLYVFSNNQDEWKSQQAISLISQTPRIALSTQVVNEVTVNILRKFQYSKT